MDLLGFGHAGCAPVVDALKNLNKHQFNLYSSRVKLRCTRPLAYVKSFKVPYWLAPNEQEKSFCFLEDETEPSSSFSCPDTLYVVQLVTSSLRGSSFSEPDVRLQFCLIGESGGTILKQVVSSDCRSSNFQKFQLQSGDINTFKFCGPDLGRLAALWIAPQTGTWRPEKVEVTVISHENKEAMYVFNGNGELLGDGGEASAAELRCCLGTTAEDAAAKKETRKRGMREYESLKFAMLSLDALLVVAGAALLIGTDHKDAAVAFSAGGAGGFLYLVLLERTVDELGSSEVKPGMLQGTTGPLVRLVLAFGFIFVAGKVVQTFTASDIPLSRGELLAGAGGFFMFRIAVLLAGLL